jgi:hypothetical protein
MGKSSMAVCNKSGGKLRGYMWMVDLSTSGGRDKKGCNLT